MVSRKKGMLSIEMKGSVKKQVKERIWDFMARQSNGKYLNMRIEGFQNFASTQSYQILIHFNLFIFYFFMVQAPVPTFPI